MSWLRYIWQVIVGLLEVSIVLAAFNIANYSNDPATFKVVISGLILIILQAASFMRLWSVTQVDYITVLYDEIREIKKKLQIEVDDESEVKEAKNRNEKLKKRAIIPTIFDGILWIIVLFNLMMTVFI